MQKTTIIFILIVLTTISSQAQLFFRNNTLKPVEVAYAMQNNSKNFSGWFTQGWFRVEPNQTMPISKATGLNNIVYYYARSVDGENLYGGQTPLYVDNINAFFIPNANLDYVKNEHPNYITLPFRMVNMHATLKTKYTIQLDY